jgi:Fe2+ transport system protein FeoA
VVERIDADESTARRLLEIGFFPGAAVEVLATMWPDDGLPLAVRVGRRDLRAAASTRPIG